MRFPQASDTESRLGGLVVAGGGGSRLLRRGMVPLAQVPPPDGGAAALRYSSRRRRESQAERPTAPGPEGRSTQLAPGAQRPKGAGVGQPARQRRSGVRGNGTATQPTCRTTGRFHAAVVSVSAGGLTHFPLGPGDTRHRSTATGATTPGRAGCAGRAGTPSGTASKPKLVARSGRRRLWGSGGAMSVCEVEAGADAEGNVRPPEPSRRSAQ
jgi:hypothetical protein